MDYTILAIVAVLLVFAGLYFIQPEGLSGIGSGTQYSDIPPEGNGLIGKVIDGVADMTWQPLEFIIIISFFLIGSLGVSIYWKSIQD